MKAMIFIGGPEPATRGKINTHLYVVRFFPTGVATTYITSYETGKSLDKKLSFSETFLGEYESFHDAFVTWLRSAYCK